MALPSRSEVASASRAAARALIETASSSGRNLARYWEQMTPDERGRQIAQVKRAVDAALDLNVFAEAQEPAKVGGAT